MCCKWVQQEKIAALVYATPKADAIVQYRAVINHSQPQSPAAVACADQTINI